MKKLKFLNIPASTGLNIHGEHYEADEFGVVIAEVPDDVAALFPGFVVPGDGADAVGAAVSDEIEESNADIDPEEKIAPEAPEDVQEAVDETTEEEVTEEEAADETPEEEEEEEIDLSKMKVAELRKLAVDAGLTEDEAKSLKKAELVDLFSRA